MYLASQEESQDIKVEILTEPGYPPDYLVSWVAYVTRINIIKKLESHHVTGESA